MCTRSFATRQQTPGGGRGCVARSPRVGDKTTPPGWPARGSLSGRQRAPCYLRTTMRLALLSDTHMPKGSRRLPDDCLARLTKADLIIHAGDLTELEVLRELEFYARVVAVHGNVDSREVRATLPETVQIEAAGATIGAIHDAGPARRRLERLENASPPPTPSCSATRTSRCTSARPTASRSSTRVARPSGGARRTGRWESPPWCAGCSRPSWSCSADRLRRRWTSPCSSPAPPARSRPPGADCPRCSCGAAATSCCSTAAREPSASCCARSA